MDYCKSQNVYFQENGLQFTPCELKDYEYFVWMISPFDGEIYYTNNNSDNSGHIALAAPCGPELISLHFKGWKVEDFERLAIELENLKS